MRAPELHDIETWAPDGRACPALEDCSPEYLSLRANGTGLCAGGFLLHYCTICSGVAYLIWRRLCTT